MAGDAIFGADEKSVVPDPSLTTNIKGNSVNGEPKEKEVFTLSHPDILSLMRYVWGGCFLPADRDEYIRRMDIDQEAISTVSKEIDLMTAAYKDIKKDNLVFRDRTWPSLVDLAGKIVNYAKTAGQDIDSSYYAQLLLAVKDFNVAKSKSPPDQKAMDEAKETIVGFTSELIGSITKLQEASAKAKGDLATFKNQTTNHSSTLKDNRDQVKKLLGGSKGEIARLEKDIKDLQKQLEDDQAEYDRDVKIAATTPTYAWCTIFGFIAAISVASVYGKKAVEMQNAMKEAQKNIDTDQKKLKAARTVNADTQRMTLGVDAVIALIDPAIKTLQKLETVWQVIKDDLQGLQDRANDHPDQVPNVVVEKVKLKNMIHRWNALAEKTDEFRKTAYISEPEILSFQDFIKKYGVKK